MSADLGDFSLIVLHKMIFTRSSNRSVDMKVAAALKVTQKVNALLDQRDS
jgi:hypothetical protein